MNPGLCPQCAAPADVELIFCKTCGARLRPIVSPSQSLQQKRSSTITFGNGTAVTPQFDKAEYLGESGSEGCAECSQPIADSYYQVNGALFCPTCAAQVRSSLPKDTHPAYVRAVLFGCGAAVLGLVLYSSVVIMTGWTIGYLSLAVGYLVGKAMMAGSRGIGGRRYQVAAVLLTYCAVSLSAIPIFISMAPKHSSVQQHQSIADGKQQGPQGQRPRISTGAAMAALGMLALIGLASPFLELQDPMHGIIGLIILFVGVQIAWRLTAAKIPEISGPFANQSVSS